MHDDLEVKVLLQLAEAKDKQAARGNPSAARRTPEEAARKDAG